MRRALGLEYLTVGWNVVEGVVAVAAGWSAGSISLVGFGADSFVESVSGAILIWRLKAERADSDPGEIERLDHAAHRLVGSTLLLLAAYVGGDALRSLVKGERPEPSVVGIVLTIVSMVVMAWLARAKRRAAAALESRALQADSFQTTACFWLSVVTLLGVGLNAAFGWWWADPAAALLIAVLLVEEGRAALHGESCGCD